MEMITTEECLKDFASKDYAKRRGLIVDFCEVSDDSANDWMSGKRLPTGERLIKLRVLLDAFGYQVADFSEFPLPYRQCAQMIALGIVDVKDVVTTLGYSNEKGVFDIVIRGKDMMPNRRFSFQNYVSAHVEMMEVKLQELYEKLSQFPSSPVSAITTTTQAQSEDDSFSPKSAVYPVDLTPSNSEEISGWRLAKLLTELAKLCQSEVSQRIKRDVAELVGNDRLEVIINYLMDVHEH